MAERNAERSQQFADFTRAFAAAARSEDKPPATIDEWETRKQQLRRKLIAAWGGFPAEKCPLEPRVLGELKRDGYRVEKVVFQTRPGVFMTANAYVPDGAKKAPAVLCVHGHWKGAKQDPVVQSRCIGLVKLGFFVLCVDAFGAGERGLSKNLGEYHGEMVGATLFPIGLPLSGLQVYENMRAADYLQSRPEVDGTKLGITGASGGGNQTMYAGAMDERFSAVVPVCSVGTYQVYLKAACCVCEVVPGAISFTEEAGVLSLVAPRGLMVVNATQDAVQFSPDEAQKSIEATRPVFELHDKSDNLRHVLFESKHDYNRAMREAMYGWMTRHLKGEGEGNPIPEPQFETEKPEDLRCYPGDSRPDDFVTIPKFAAAVGREIVARRESPDHLERWEGESLGMRHALERDVLGIRVVRGEPRAALKEDELTWQPEPNLELAAAVDLPKKAERLAVVVDLDRGRKALEDPLAVQLQKKGWGLVVPELRGRGRGSVPGDKIGRAPDHNSAEWSMWIGQPLLGQWTVDVRRLIDALTSLEATKEAAAKGVTLIGLGPGGLVAVCAAALDQRVSRAACVGTLASFVSDGPYENQRMGIIAPHILSKVGDVAHLAALIAPRPVIFAGGVSGSGEELTQESLEKQFAFAADVFRLLKGANRLTVTTETDAEKLATRLE